MSFFDRFRRIEKEAEVEETRRLVQHAAELHGVPAHEVVDTILDVDDDEEQEEKEYGRPSRHLGVWVTMVMVGVVFGVGIIFLMKLANGADQAGPKALSGVQAIQASIQPTPKNLPTLTGQFISFQYPSIFDAIETLPAIPNSAERYMIGSSASYERSINVEVENNTPELTDDSGYEFRTESPSVYRPEKTTVSQDAAVVMVKTDGTERTLYWAHAGKVVIISVTNTTGSDNLESFMSVIVSTMRWI